MIEPVMWFLDQQPGSLWKLEFSGPTLARPIKPETLDGSAICVELLVLFERIKNSVFCGIYFLLCSQLYPFWVCPGLFKSPRDCVKGRLLIQ
jgi:hypothetical protein